MTDEVGLSADRRVRHFRSISEKRQIVQLALKSGASVAEVARAHGVNANQVFKWRRAFERGELTESSTALIPVTVTSAGDCQSEAKEGPQASSAGALHIELPGRRLIIVENGADPLLVRSILQSLRK